MGCLLVPFRMLWGFFGFLLGFLGRVVGAVLGLGLMIAGVALCITVIGAIAGAPLLLFGLLLLIKSFFP